MGLETDLENQQEQTLTGDVDKRKKKTLKRSAVRLAGFMFWTNFAAFVSLMIGCFAPGWLTIGKNDLSLWHLTKCYLNSKHPIDAVKTFNRCEIISYYLVARPPMDLHADLDYIDLVEAEVLYCIGMVLSFVTLIKFYQRRQKIAKGICDEICLRKWVLLFIMASLSAVLVLLPVGMFSGIKEKDSFVPLFSGMVFAGFGGASMTLIATSMLLCFPVLPCKYFQFDDTQIPV